MPYSQLLICLDSTVYIYKRDPMLGLNQVWPKLTKTGLLLYRNISENLKLPSPPLAFLWSVSRRPRLAATGGSEDSLSRHTPHILSHIRVLFLHLACKQLVPISVEHGCFPSDAVSVDTWEADIAAQFLPDRSWTLNGNRRSEQMKTVDKSWYLTIPASRLSWIIM